MNNDRDNNKGGNEHDNKQDKQGKRFGKNRRYRREGRKEGNDQRNPEVRETNNPINDPSWYYVNELIGKATGSIPYNIFAGERIDLQPGTGITDNSNKGTPGVFKIKYVTCPGISIDSSSAVNIAARALYSWVRHQNSGHSNYESCDLMLYVLAMDKIYTLYFEAKRIYEIAMTYDYVNRNIPDLLLQALDVDPDNIRANLAQFRAGLNILAAKISSLAVPNKFHLFKRHAILASNVFMDSSSMRSQFYVWAQNATHKYNAKHTGGGALERVALGANRTYTTILQEIEDILQPVITDDDMNIMSGDILKAYGRENCYVLPNVDESATVPFVFDENMLAQIENSMSATIDANSMDIYQSTNTLMFNPTFTNGVVTNSFIFNSHKDDPDWKDTLEWSRGTSVNGKCGTELIVGYTLKVRGYDANNALSVQTLIYGSYIDVAASNFEEVIINQSKFDWHPFIYLYSKTGGTIDSFHGYIGDVKKFTVLSTAEISKLHDSAIMGELNALLLTQNTTR